MVRSGLMGMVLAVAVAGCGSAGAGEEGAAPRGGAGTALAFGRQPVATGIGVHYAVQGDPEGPAVVLLHGYSDSWFSYSAVLPLIPEGYRVYALDLRGHGDTDKPADGYGIPDLAADVIAFMDARGIDRAVVAGHSLGSFVAQQVASAAPDRVAGLVLLAGAPTVHYLPGVDDFIGLVSSFTDSVPLDFIREFQVGTVYQPLPDAFMERVVEESRKLPPHVWRGIAEGMHMAEAARPGADGTVPTLVMWGDRDGIFPREAQDSLVTIWQTAGLEVYPETGHALHWERPREVTESMMRFVANVAPAPGS